MTDMEWFDNLSHNMREDVARMLRNFVTLGVKPSEALRAIRKVMTDKE